MFTSVFCLSEEPIDLNSLAGLQDTSTSTMYLLHQKQMSRSRLSAKEDSAEQNISVNNQNHRNFKIIAMLGPRALAVRTKTCIIRPLPGSVLLSNELNRQFTYR